MKSMLIAGNDSEGVGSGPAICSTAAVATRTLFGFGAPVDPCGSITRKGPYITAGGGTGTIGNPE